jgi:hypothetical protein
MRPYRFPEPAAFGLRLPGAEDFSTAGDLMETRYLAKPGYRHFSMENLRRPN